MTEDSFEGSWSMLLEGDRSSPSTKRVSLPLRVRSASLVSLTELCIFCFDEQGTVRAATSYPYVFFLMHKWFTTSEELVFHLRKIFEAGRPSYNNKDEYLALLSSFQQLDPSDVASTQDNIQNSSNPPSVIMNGKQDECNENVGLRNLAQIGLLNGRSNSVLIPRSACIGVEDENYYYSKLNSLVDRTEDLIRKAGNPTIEIDKAQTESIQSSESSCPTSSCKHDHSVMCPVYEFRRSVCYAAHFWISQFPVHYDLDVKLSALMKEWQQCLFIEDQGINYSELAPLVDLSCLPSYDWIRNISVRDPNIKLCRKVSLVFNHLEPMDLATNLTYLEHRIMRRISFQDFKNYAITQSLRDIPRLERSINFFNGLTHWVQCIVLSRSTAEQRAEVFVKLIEVTKRLKELRNFNSLFAIVGGLNHSSLARLTRTTSRIPSDSQRSLAELSDFLSSTSNFSNYRRTLQDCKGFKIPILGVHMKDLISLHVALPDVTDGGLINFRKIIQLSVIFKELQELQNHPLLPGANILLVNTLRLSLELAYTEDEIYELSLAREPKDISSISPPHSPTRSLGEWPSIGLGIQISNASSTKAQKCMNDKVTGVTQISTLLQQKPLNDPTSHSLAEAHTGDSAINQQRENGKTIPQSLCATDKTSAFIQHGSNVHKRDFNFPGHIFQETTSFFLPCICNHCNGLLWGPFLRQGSFHKCRVCDYKICSSCYIKYSASNMCNDVNISCRPKTIASSCSISESLDNSTNRIRFRYRKKLSSQSEVDYLETKSVGGILPFMASVCEKKESNAGTSTTTAIPSSPIPIFQRKTSFLFPTTSHSYSGSETRIEDQWSPRSFFNTSPKRRIQGH